MICEAERKLVGAGWSGLLTARPEEMKGPRGEDIGISGQKIVDILQRLRRLIFIVLLLLRGKSGSSSPPDQRSHGDERKLSHLFSQISFETWESVSSFCPEEPSAKQSFTLRCREGLLPPVGPSTDSSTNPKNSLQTPLSPLTPSPLKTSTAFILIRSESWKCFLTSESLKNVRFRRRIFTLQPSRLSLAFGFVSGGAARHLDIQAASLQYWCFPSVRTIMKNDPVTTSVCSQMTELDGWRGSFPNRNTRFRCC